MEECVIDGCNGDPRVTGTAKGMCRPHYYQHRKQMRGRAESCTYEGCDAREIRARGMCSLHYFWWHRDGNAAPLQDFSVDAEAGVIYGKRGQPVGSTDSSGYQQITVITDGRKVLHSAHRWIWAHVYGPIPEGMEINHKNGVKKDNRIANLELVTHQQNIQHAYDTGLKSNKGMKHPKSKLTEEQVYEIRRRMDSGDHYLSVAEDFGVVYTTVYEIAARKTWPHLPERESA